MSVWSAVDGEIIGDMAEGDVTVDIEGDVEVEGDVESDRSIHVFEWCGDVCVHDV